jgi:hypothetical protein
MLLYEKYYFNISKSFLRNLTMSKILISLALVFSLGTTSLVAAQAQEVQKLSKADAQLLFW